MLTIRMASLFFIVLGMSILLPVAVSVALETWGDYSRRLYITMLVSCAGLQAAECVFALQNGAGGGIGVAVFRFSQCLFFILISVLCFCWTLYAYYWFNRRRPGRKTAVLFWLGPLLEVLMILLNPFTGNIYTIGADGSYARGSLFPLFIVFSYAYLMTAVAVTAVGALKNDSENRNRDYLLFFLFFVFPVIGPVLQYLFPVLPLMGVSQAIALLTVYLAVQQRTAAQYAVEKARYEDDYRKYENSLEELFSVSPESLCIFHLNLTKNLITEEHGTSPFVKALLRGNGVDELFRNIAGIITDQEDAAHFSEIFNRQHLLEEFSRMHPQILLKYHRMIDEKESHLVKTSLSMLKNPDGGDIEAIVYSSDIDRQEKEEQVISAITNREYDYIALIDAKTEKINYQYTSRKAADSVYFRMGNYNESMKEAIAQMYVPEERGHYYEQISFGKVLEALSRQEEYSYIFSCNDTAGQSRQKKISFRYLDEKKREILFFRSDITEEMRQEREQSDRLRTALNEAQHANAMKTEFLSNVSHDMRTPLNAVIGYTDLARKTEDPAVQTAYLDKIDKAGKILLSLINDTLDLSKIENGIITLKPIPVSCDEVVKKVISSVKPAMDEKRIHFVLDNSRAVMAEIRVDPLRLQEIFINLLSNAVKFTPEEGRVELIIECVRLEDRCVHDKITVRDTGCGMSSDFLPKIFEPFTQERQAATADVGGSGLGLSIVKKLVDMMDGRIEVQSELGKGSAFTVWLDFERTDSRTEQQGSAKKTFEDLQGRHILLVEDNAMNMEIAGTLLKMQGMTVSCAENGETACRMFAESAPGTFDAVLMDIRMPVMNGYTAAQTIRKMDRADAAGVPIIAMSADAFDDDVRAAAEAGMNGHIAKPVDPDRLMTTLSACIAGRGQAG